MTLLFFISYNNLAIVVLGMTVLVCFTFCFCFTIYCFYKQKMQQLYIQYLERAHQQQLLFSAITYEELQRQHFSKQMHTSIYPHINRMGSLLTEMYFRAAKSSVASLFDESRQELQQLMQTTNRLSFDISPHHIEYSGLEASLKILLEKYELQQLCVTFHFQKSSPRLLPERELFIYRVIEELIQNTTKYSGATHIFIIQKFQDSIYQLKLAHNGYGLEQSSYEQMLHQHSGLGLKRVTSLMQAANGTIQFCKEDYHYHILLDFQP